MLEKCLKGIDPLGIGLSIDKLFYRLIYGVLSILLFSQAKILSILVAVDRSFCCL